MARIAKQFDFSNLNDADKTVLIEMLQEKILLLEEKNTKLEKMLDTAKSKQKKNSKNSHKPPSSDIHPPKSTNKTKKSNKSPGGQVGHKGKNLKMIDNPDHIIRLPVSECNHCGKSLKKVKGSIKCRQEFEIPVPRLIVTEYQSESKACCCGWTTSSCFPEHITHISQYGFRAKSLMVYMNQYQYLPYDRASQFFETIYKHKISPATILNSCSLLPPTFSLRP
jgi:transposase